jgi:hypothetical protein
VDVDTGAPAISVLEFRCSDSSVDDFSCGVTVAVADAEVDGPSSDE